MDRLHALRVGAGLSSILLTFRPGTDLYRARQMTGERLTQAFALPHVSKPPTMMQPTSSISRVMLVGLSSDTVSPIDLSVLARWTVGPRLMGVPGVSNVAIWGQRDRQLQVQVDPRHLRAQNVSLLQVIETAGNAMWVSSLRLGGGVDFRGLADSSRPAAQRLGDPARVPNRIGGRSGPGASRGNAVPAGRGSHGSRGPPAADRRLRGYRRRGPVAGCRELPGRQYPGGDAGSRTRAGRHAAGPSGVEINPSMYRPASYIEQGIDNVSRSLLVGYLLVTLALGLSLFAWRAVLVGLVAIPLSLLTGALVLQLRGASINEMVVAGLCDCDRRDHP